MEINEKQFIAGFNSGYTLAKHEPTLLTSLLKDISPVTSYTQGMSSGQKEYEIEQTNDRLNELKQLKAPDKDITGERDL